MTYVIPSLIPVFADSGVELPQSTKMLIATSDFISDNLSLIFVILISIALFITGYKNTESGRIMFHSMYLKIPLVSELYRNYIIANVASNFGSLIGG
jgi:type II secretory pathway component PulF